MKILIIEDEVPAAARLEKMILELLPASTIIGKLDTVKTAVEFFKNKTADLVMMDIQLADGISFEIFERCEVSAPVIFTTAYDEYAVKAFKVNSLDYLLKPVDKEELKRAISKFQAAAVTLPSVKMIESLQDAVSKLSRRYKSRFVLKVGEHLRTVETANVLFFFSQEKTTFCYTTDNRRHILDYTLEEVEELIDPALFFRVNRKYLVSAGSIDDIVHYTNSRLHLVLKNSTDNDIVVSREKVQDFKSWLDR